MQLRYQPGEERSEVSRKIWERILDGSIRRKDSNLATNDIKLGYGSSRGFVPVTRKRFTIHTG